MNEASIADRSGPDGPDRPDPAPAGQPPRADVRRRRGLSLVWAVPVVAALIAGFLAWRSYTTLGPVVTITFATAEGLAAGTTKLRYLDVEVGTVEGVAIGDDLRHIVVTARMVPSASAYLRDGTRFWIVRPRVGVGGVSGLGTLLSGAYIGVEPGEGEGAWAFRGLEEPPPIRSNQPGRQYVLRADRLGSLASGSPVFYRGIEVGQVLGHELIEGARAVDVTIFVQEPHADLVRGNSRFWNASGIDFATDAGGIRVEVGSVQSVLLGGVEFETPPSSAATDPAAAGARFPLYGSRAAVARAQFTEKVPFLTHFDGSVRGLSVGAPVEFRGFQLGTVSEVRLEFDPATQRIRIPVLLELEPQRLIAYGTRVDTEDDIPLMDRLVRQGLRAQLQTGNLLTGELYVDLTLVPDAAPATLDTSGPVPVIPSVPNTLEALQASATEILNKLASLPIDQIAASLNRTVSGVETLVASPELQEGLRRLGPALTQLQDTIAQVGGSSGPLLASLRATTDAAADTLRQAETTLGSAQRTVGPDSRLADDLEGLIGELTRAARSVRVFADYLDRHPEALIRGKTGSLGR